MNSCGWKVQESSSCSVPQDWMSQLIFYVCWNLEEVGSNGSGGDVLAIWQQAGKEQKLLSSMLLYRLQEEGMSHIKGMFSCFKIWTKDPCLPAPRSGSRWVFLPQRSRLEVDSSTSNQAENLSQVCSLSLDCSSFQIYSNWQPRIAITEMIRVWVHGIFNLIWRLFHICIHGKATWHP